MTEATNNNTKITVNLGDVIKSNWQIISLCIAIAMSLIGMFYTLPQVQEDTRENSDDIKTLNVRMNNVEGDIKAIREGIDFIKTELK